MIKNLLILFNITGEKNRPLTIQWHLATGILLLTIFSSTTTLRANETPLNQAEAALENQQYEQALHLFKKIENDQSFKTQALFGLARIAFYTNQLDDAEDYVTEVLKASSDNPEHLFIAARIAAKQAQSASIFSKLGYAKDAKRYFTRALEIDNSHQPSLIGLIRFHQQAPVMAGGDKDAIPELINKLRLIDKRAAFSFEVPDLLKNKKVEEAIGLYRDALNSTSTIDIGRFKFDFAMMLSNQGHYESALKELISIELNNDGNEPDFADMRLYQIGKLAAESKSHLQLGLRSIAQYAAIPAENRLISKDWVNFRIAQLQFLSEGKPGDTQPLVKLMTSTSDKDLKNKIQSLLEENKL
ncbi:tetratricopeptide repeat protein [Aliikangiella coralliicola]|uniref:Tetratricopeptide repeat protein n=1 Tax=Aliikangiella coralliicola TaxID=2592383 RepID=A0A545UII3_9GAMM|nr:tetratricopeptide repeat protein [Aliikangiella coralliicola]TQV89276.1 tetratricopeptide repeat protein [Aliikangiella coralliicola]